MKNKELYWLSAKISFSFFWGSNMIKMVLECSRLVAPVGIVRWLDYSFLFDGKVKLLVLFAILLLSFFYVREREMKITTSIMFFVSLLVISFHESQGVFYRNTSYTVIPGVQALAYWVSYFRKETDIEKWRIQYTLQAIAAFYLLAGLSKLNASGIDWIFSGKYFALQVMKNHYFNYFNTADTGALAIAAEQTAFFLQHNNLLIFLLASSLLLELFAFTALFGEKWQLGIGILLLGMHIGIYVVMGILIGGIAFNMVIFFLNPLYYLIRIMDYFSGGKLTTYVSFPVR